MLIATLVGVIILPLIYGGLYLWAFWDPYGKINEIPVAVVNLDVGENDEYLGNDLVETLKDKMAMKWVFVDMKTAEDGLTSKKYYSMAVIPKDFTHKIVNADKKDASQTYLEYKNREASNFMAAKFTNSAFIKIQATLNKEVSKKYFDEIFKESIKSANKLKDAVDGAKEIENGLHDLATGSAKLNDGLSTGYSGADALNDGANKAYDGADKLNTGLDNLVIGLNSADPLVKAMAQYLSDGHDATMSAYFAKFGGALTQTKNGVSQLKNGSGELKEGLFKLKDGAGTLRVGVNEMKTGSQTIYTNLLTAEDGANELKTKLDESRIEALNKVQGKKTDVMSEPVALKEEPFDLVANNGTAFTPYFIPLALWVGAMAIFFLIEFDGKIGPKIILTLIIGAIQAVVLDLVLIRYLGLNVRMMSFYFIFSIILAWSSDMIQFFLNRFLKEAGKFVAIIILILQLTTSAGTYPLETNPSFFRSVNPYLPMTYAVSTFREIISGGSYQIAISGAKVVAIIFLVFLLLNIVLTINFKCIKIRNHKKHEKPKQKKRHTVVRG